MFWVFGFLGLIAWFAVTFGPVGLAFVAWALGGRLRHGWVVHLCFFPTVLTAMWLGTNLIFFAAGDTGVSPPGLGIAMLPAIVILLMTLIIYYGTLAYRFVVQFFSENPAQAIDTARNAADAGEAQTIVESK